MATRQRLKQRLKRGFRIPSRSIIKSALIKTSKLFLVGLVMSMFSSVPKRTKISILAKIDRAPKKSTGKRKRRSTARKSRRRKSSKGKSKRSKASIRAQRLRNLKKARAAKKRKR